MKTDGVQRVDSNAGFPADARNETPAAQAPAQATQRAASADKTKTESPGTGQAKPNTSSAATALAQYNTYAKYASTIVRQILFGDSRFNNSKLVANTMLAALQVKGGLVPPNFRVGTLAMTRTNAAVANISKGVGYIVSAIDKIKAGKNADDDIVSATALIGEGLTEISAGLGADVGNHLVKQWQTELGKTSSTIGTGVPPSPTTSGTSSGTVSEAGTGTPIPESAVGSEVDASVAHLPPMSPEEHGALMQQSMQTYNQNLDAQLVAMHDQEVQGIVAELEKTPPGNQPARIVELSADAQRKIASATQLAEGVKKDAAARKAQSEAELTELDKDMKGLREQLKSGRYTDPGVAGMSHEDAARNLGAKLLSYRRREEEIAQGFEILTEDAIPNLAEMSKQQLEIAKSIGSLEGLSKEEKLSRLQKLKKDYREFFMKYQNFISEPTANLPEWLKISPALKAQLGPALINTAFAAADFGARVDDYIKKVADGTATEADRVRLAGSTIGLIGGMVSFIPVIGPIISIGLAIAGIGISNAADSLADEAAREKASALRDEAVRAYRQKHPGTENYVYESDVGAGA
ncbi:hypothetical protein KZJ38_21905 [Paraburkholderia edwinii]|uniref:Uncharacterized protein n=1 Tax=Paraburkholderia edwinii TaxID=2861782 RepID=A0ABX8UJE6_9BURK|nr:hypothetical protein [Paraburkholderia edwinii]QYD68831.1 hypothetical protein KZJ38_21905 [Paraburkholderia edwinii]